VCPDVDGIAGLPPAVALQQSRGASNARSSVGSLSTIIDRDGPLGEALGLFDSSAILLCLADKAGKLNSTDPVRRWETIQ
jgi:hypothetical protein